MPQDGGFGAFRRFYAKGGYTETPSKKPSRLQEIEMALWGSQNMAEGGWGPKAKDAIEALVQYLGGYKRAPIERHIWAGQQPPSYTKFAEDAPRLPPEATRAVSEYTSSDYNTVNPALRRLGPYEDIDKFPYKTTRGRIGLWEANVDDWRMTPAEAALARANYTDERHKEYKTFRNWLERDPYTLPGDLFRGTYVPRFEDEFGFNKVPQMHGLGFGSFSFSPDTAAGFTNREPYFLDYAGKLRDTQPWDKQAPALLRIKKGTEISGKPVEPWSSASGENEVVMAPRKGFDVLDLWKSKNGLPLIDIAPTQDFSFYTPQIYGDGGEVGGYAGGYAGGGMFKELRDYIRNYSQPIKAWHGSPHDFDRFDSRFLGSGEGAQAFGYGQYFAENPEVAKWYRESLAGAPEPWYMRYQNHPIFEPGGDLNDFPEEVRRGATELHARLSPYKNPADPKILDRVRDELSRTLANADIAKRENRAFWSDKIQKLDYPDRNAPYPWIDWDDHSVVSHRDALNLLNNPMFSVTPGRTPGKMYGVDLYAEPHQFLDSNLKIHDQPREVWQALNKRGLVDEIDPAQTLWDQGWFPGKNEAADLADLGIPGSRFWDGTSRKIGTGTRNYVVFPGADDLIDIHTKYAKGGSVKLSKESVDYSMGMGTHRCGNCAHFQKPHGCELVQGNINPRFWCQKFLLAKKGGGGVDLPNLPNSMPQYGPMHYGSDEGFAGGGQFWRWMKNLAWESSDAERKAMNEVVDATRGHGKEALVIGDQYNSDLSNALRNLQGDADSVVFPPGYREFMKTTTDPFTVHTHPGPPHLNPSSADLNVWANSLPGMNADPHVYGRQAMWIKGITNPHNTLRIDPAAEDLAKRYFDQLRPAKDILERRQMMGQGSRDDYFKAMMEYARDSGIGTGDFKTDNWAYQGLDAGRLINKMSQHIPIHVDPEAVISPYAPRAVGDVWPDFVDYLDKRKVYPYADGGPVMTPPDNMGEPSDMELAYNSQFFAGGGKVNDALKKVTEWLSVHVPEESAHVEVAKNPTYDDVVRQIKDLNKANNDKYSSVRMFRDPAGDVYSWDAMAATHPGMGRAMGFEVEPEVNPHVQLESKGLRERFGGYPLDPDWYREYADGGHVRHPHHKSAIEQDTINRLWLLLGNVLGGIR